MLVHNSTRDSRRPIPSPVASIARNNDGTSTSLVTDEVSSASINRSKSLTTSSAKITNGTPLSSGPKISQMESTKLSDVFWQQTSPGAKGYWRYIHSSRFMVAPCKPTTPFGLPVEPEV